MGLVIKSVITGRVAIMEKNKFLGKIKWVVCALLMLNIAVLLLPYADAGSYGLFNPIQMIQEFSKDSENGVAYVVEAVMDFIVPAALVFIAGLLLIGRIRVVRYVFASLLSTGALSLYIYYLTSDFFSGMHGNESIGFWLNFFIAVVGVIAPIAFIILNKQQKKEI